MATVNDWAEVAIDTGDLDLRDAVETIILEFWGH